MYEKSTDNRYWTLFWRYVIGAAVLWTFIVGGSLVWNLYLLDLQALELAKKEALANFNKDQAFRLWGTKHGGVYAPITEETQPSPYLAHIPDRDIETPSGRKLTLLNPAYMVRQLMDEYTDLYGIRGKITGFVLLRPGNAPDEWEKVALGKLRDGAEEVSEIAEINGVAYHRMMRAMYMKPGCEKCHGHLGFKEGDFRGGVGVSVPLQPYIKNRDETAFVFSASHGGLWLLGLSGLGFGARQVRRRIVERDNAEVARRESEERYALVENAVNDGVWDWNVLTDEDYLSPRWKNLLGFREDELENVASTFIDLIHPEDRQKVADAVAAHFNEKAPYKVEARMHHKDGRYLWFLLRGEAQRDVEGNPIRMVGSISDITERKQAENQLVDAIESFSSGFSLYDKDDRLVLFNSHFKKSLEANAPGTLKIGRTFEEMLNDWIAAGAYDIPEEEQAAFVAERVRDRRSAPKQFETRLRDGHWVFISEYKTNDGGTAVVITDISEIKQAEEALENINADLELRVEDRTKELESAHKELLQQEKLATLGKLTATVTHELRNPLGVMSSSAYLLGDHLKGGDRKAIAAVERIERNVVRCDRIIDELLDFTRIRPLDAQPTVLDDWLDGLLNELSVAEGVELVRDFGADGAVIYVDSETLRRAVINLYENAIQAMTEMEGAAECTNRRLTVRTWCDRGQVVIAISDTGVGIVGEVQEHIFEPMFSTKGFGVGLGLPVVRNIAEQHGGTVNLAANPDGQGTSATLRLPLFQAP